MFISGVCNKRSSHKVLFRLKCPPGKMPDPVLCKSQSISKSSFSFILFFDNGFWLVFPTFQMRTHAQAANDQFTFLLIRPGFIIHVIKVVMGQKSNNRFPENLLHGIYITSISFYQICNGRCMTTQYGIY